MKSVLIFVVLFIGYSCQGKPVITSKTAKPAETQSRVEPINLDSLWQFLVFDKGGCLTGGQHAHDDGTFGGEGCVLTDNQQDGWKPFFYHPKEELRNFLIAQLADTSITRIHTCPLMPASEGEVAVYCLAKIYLMNWYDFTPFLEYQDREVTGVMDSEQSWLQAILENPKQREVLIQEWQKL